MSAKADDPRMQSSNSEMRLAGILKRLEEVIEQSGKSQREISIAAGKGPGYVNSLFKEGKEPGLSNLLDICDAAGVSSFYVIFGVEIDPKSELILRQLSDNPDAQDAILNLLEKI